MFSRQLLSEMAAGQRPETGRIRHIEKYETQSEL
ncbi:hypothetical protein SAMN05216278_2585 [Halopelagius longus]|uniref:Uncharacterized protein n=1 Tax=Halopelagius longus TaxID=1236180 RepID=A0A1H1DUC0_9EURY|nr:hypothetical protein SAMN05216278_2585 [Halopelagius longus]